jgi:integrase
VQRVLKAAKACLTYAADLDPRIGNRSAWKTGLGGIGDSYTQINRVLSDADVRRLVLEAYADDPCFGRLVHVLAETGTRTRQACGLLVADLVGGQAPRLTMPSSRKGSGKRAITRKPVPITPALAEELAAAVGNRPGDAPLLVSADGTAWASVRGSDLWKLFDAVARRAGIEASAYSLRHSSIVRALLANVPTRVVASAHDTSTTVLERVYSRYISDFADTVARRGLIEISGPPAFDNVVAIAARR